MIIASEKTGSRLWEGAIHVPASASHLILCIIAQRCARLGNAPHVVEVMYGDVSPRRNPDVSKSDSLCPIKGRIAQVSAW
jgi:hypothetical protein